jgi:hypothetical protein
MGSSSRSSDSSGQGAARKGRGGRRPGAGRPPGSKNALPQGAVAAIRALKLRVPADASPEVEELAAETLATTVEIMRRGYRTRGAMVRLLAAKEARVEVCGKVAEKHEHSGTITHAHLVAEAAK